MYGIVKVCLCDKEDYNIRFDYAVVKLSPKGKGFFYKRDDFIRDLIVPPTGRFDIAPYYNFGDSVICYADGTSEKEQLENVIAGFTNSDDATAFCEDRNRACKKKYTYTLQFYDSDNNTTTELKREFTSFEGIPNDILLRMARMVSGVDESVTYSEDDKISEMKGE